MLPQESSVTPYSHTDSLEGSCPEQNLGKPLTPLRSRLTNITATTVIVILGQEVMFEVQQVCSCLLGGCWCSDHYDGLGLNERLKLHHTNLLTYSAMSPRAFDGPKSPMKAPKYSREKSSVRPGPSLLNYPPSTSLNTGQVINVFLVLLT